MSKDNVALFGSITFLLFCIALDLWRVVSAVKRRPKITVPDVAYQMTLIHQQEKEQAAQQPRLIYNADFYDYYQAALEENPGLTERAAVHLYMYDTSLPGNFPGGNSGESEEKA